MSIRRAINIIREVVGAPRTSELVIRNAKGSDLISQKSDRESVRVSQSE